MLGIQVVPHVAYPFKYSGAEVAGEFSIRKLWETIIQFFREQTNIGWPRVWNIGDNFFCFSIKRKLLKTFHHSVSEILPFSLGLEDWLEDQLFSRCEDYANQEYIAWKVLNGLHSCSLTGVLACVIPTFFISMFGLAFIYLSIVQFI